MIRSGYAQCVDGCSNTGTLCIAILRLSILLSLTPVEFRSGSAVLMSGMVLMCCDGRASTTKWSWIASIVYNPSPKRTEILEEVIQPFEIRF